MIIRCTGLVNTNFSSLSLRNGVVRYLVWRLHNSLILFLCSMSILKWHREIVNDDICEQYSPIMIRETRFISSQSTSSSLVNLCPVIFRAENTE